MLAGTGTLEKLVHLLDQSFAVGQNSFFSMKLETLVVGISKGCKVASKRMYIQAEKQRN